VNPDLLVLVASLEFALAVVAIWRGFQMEFVVLFVLLLLRDPHAPAAPAVLVPGAIAYVSTVLWRIAQIPTRLRTRVLVWLVRHGIGDVDLLGIWPRTPIVIAAATSLAVLMPDTLTLVALVALVVATVSTSPEWRRGWFGERPDFGAPIEGLTLVASGLALGLTGLFLLLFGAIGWADPAAAKEVLPQLLIVQIAVGLFPLTALTAAAPFVAGAAGAGAATALPLRRVLLALMVVLFSIAIDVLWLGKPLGRGDLEWAEVLGVAAIVIALIASINVALYLQPHRVSAELVRRLDRRWLVEVVRLYGDPYSPWLVADRFPDIERLLYIAATKESDIRLFRATLVDILERLHPIAHNAPVARAEIGLDAYFARALAALLEDAGRQGKGWVLDALIRFRGQLTDYLSAHGAAQQVPALLERTGFADPPAGMQLNARILEVGLAFSLSEPGQFAIGQMSAYAERRLAALPDPTGVYEIDPAAPVAFQPEHPAQKAADGIEGFIESLRRWADDAADAGRFPIGESIAFALARLSRESRDLASANWAGWLAHKASFAAYIVAVRGVRAGQLWFEVPDHMSDADAANPSHARAMERLGYWVPLTVASCASVASYMLVTDTAMLALGWLSSFPEEAAALGAAIEYIKMRQQALPPSAERALVLRECDRRLEQVRSQTGAHRDDYDAAKATALVWLQHEIDVPGPGGEVY